MVRPRGTTVLLPEQGCAIPAPWRTAGADHTHNARRSPPTTPSSTALSNTHGTATATACHANPDPTHNTTSRRTAPSV